MTRPWRKHPRWSAEQHWVTPNERMSPAVRAQLQAHRSRLGYSWKQTMCRLQNKHRWTDWEKLFWHVATSTEGFPTNLWVSRGMAEAIFTPTGKQQFHPWFESKGRFTRHHPSEWTCIHKNMYLWFSERWFSPTLHHRGLYSNNVSTEQDPQIPAACMGAPSFLLQSALLATLFSAALPPAVIYLETSRLAWRCMLHRSRGKQDRIQRKRTVESQPAMSPAPKQAVTQLLLLTDACS